MGITSITFSPGSQLKSLVHDTFYYLNLLEFTIPQSVSSITGVAFSFNGNMKNIYVDAMNQYFWSDNKAVYNKDKTVIYYCASACGDSYIIPDSVIRIEKGCFINSNLINIIIPDSVQEILSYGFYFCRRLKQVQLPPNLTVLSYRLFTGSALTSIRIPSKVKNLESEVFDMCNSLKTIVLPDNLEDIGGSALLDIPDLNVTLTSPSLYIDKQLIIYSNNNKTVSQYLGRLNKVIIPHTVTRIKTKAFYQKVNLNTAIFDDEPQLQYIDVGTFYGCSNLYNFTFGNQIMYIGDRAFENTVLNTHISFPSTLIAIYSSAFRNCNRIPSISFSSSTQLQLFESAFQDCDSITYITFNTNPSISIGSDCFNGLSSLNTIQIPNYVSSIESACFANCGLTRIIFENNMITSTILSPSIFKGCESLTSFTIPSNCYSIGSNALSGTSITHLDIPDYVSIFDVYCFAFCSSLRSITIKNSSKLTSIRLGVFRGCSNFETINEFRSENFVCENGALYSSDRIKMHVYPPASKRNYFYLLEGVISIEDSAFIGCANLQAVLLPEKSLVKIGQSSFEGCINLRQITIPSSVVSIGENAFSNCPLLNCGALIQNINNKTFINILKKSGLDISSAKHCSEFSCKANMISKTNHPITVIAVFILM